MICLQSMILYIRSSQIGKIITVSVYIYNELVLLRYDV
jgi:hypothetical protein